ncbi:MAG: hypothetical protein SF069_03105 [Phycisphaerae bacterium]|nr:hypothetical protein [Phycisphaerae bacterium]
MTGLLFDLGGNPGDSSTRHSAPDTRNAKRGRGATEQVSEPRTLPAPNPAGRRTMRFEYRPLKGWSQTDQVVARELLVYYFERLGHFLVADDACMRTCIECLALFSAEELRRAIDIKAAQIFAPGNGDDARKFIARPDAFFAANVIERLLASDGQVLDARERLQRRQAEQQREQQRQLDDPQREAQLARERAAREQRERDDLARLERERRHAAVHVQARETVLARLWSVAPEPLRRRYEADAEGRVNVDARMLYVTFHPPARDVYESAIRAERERLIAEQDGQR